MADDLPVVDCPETHFGAACIYQAGHKCPHDFTQYAKGQPSPEEAATLDLKDATRALRDAAILHRKLSAEIAQPLELAKANYAKALAAFNRCVAPDATT